MARVLVLWCPDWAVTAAGYGRRVAAAVVSGRVVACSQAARDAGVRIGQRRREAERYCADLIVAARDHAQEARAFEPVIAGLCALVPEIEVMRPGLCALSARGPARYFGGEQACAELLASTATLAIEADDPPVVGIGIAESHFAATLAAHRHLIVPAGATAAFLAPLPIGTLGDVELADLLGQFGITTLGAFSALSPSVVAARFGRAGELAHLRARGEEHRPVRAQIPQRDPSTKAIFEIAIERVDVALFSARQAAMACIDDLATQGLGCSRIRIEIETEHGERLVRSWRAEYCFDGDALIERLRWQLEGWLSGTIAGTAPTAGISGVFFVPDELVFAIGQQGTLFGGTTDADRRARRGIDRLSGLLGEHGVLTAALRGGRGPADRVVFTPWGRDEPAPIDKAPWPGRHPLPAPAMVHPTPIPIQVCSKDGRAIVVSARGDLTAHPAQLINKGVSEDVVGWGGPWLSDERFWDRDTKHRRARFQLVLEGGSAHLCFVEHSQWFIEATYD